MSRRNSPVLVNINFKCNNYYLLEIITFFFPSVNIKNAITRSWILDTSWSNCFYDMFTFFMSYLFSHSLFGKLQNRLDAILFSLICHSADLDSFHIAKIFHRFREFPQIQRPYHHVDLARYSTYMDLLQASS